MCGKTLQLKNLMCEKVCKVKILCMKKFATKNLMCDFIVLYRPISSYTGLYRPTPAHTGLHRPSIGLNTINRNQTLVQHFHLC